MAPFAWSWQTGTLAEPRGSTFPALACPALPNEPTNVKLLLDKILVLSISDSQPSLCMFVNTIH